MTSGLIKTSDGKITLKPYVEEGEFRKYGSETYAILELSNNPSLRKELVSNNPDLALQMYHLSKNRELAELFVENYAESQDFHQAAYFISLDLEKPIERRAARRTPFHCKGMSQEGLFEWNAKMSKAGTHYYGSTKGSEMWVFDNANDNRMKLIEEDRI